MLNTYCTISPWQVLGSWWGFLPLIPKFVFLLPLPVPPLSHPPPPNNGHAGRGTAEWAAAQGGSYRFRTSGGQAGTPAWLIPPPQFEEIMLPWKGYLVEQANYKGSLGGRSTRKLHFGLIPKANALSSLPRNHPSDWSPREPGWGFYFSILWCSWSGDHS
jgi:hypothetical protein